MNIGRINLTKNQVLFIFFIWSMIIGALVHLKLSAGYIMTASFTMILTLTYFSCQYQNIKFKFKNCFFALMLSLLTPTPIYIQSLLLFFVYCSPFLIPIYSGMLKGIAEMMGIKFSKKAKRIYLVIWLSPYIYFFIGDTADWIFEIFLTNWLLLCTYLIFSLELSDQPSKFLLDD